MEDGRSLGNNKRMQNSIDRLPDEVLISIVSLLSLKEAVRTSVLARRWRYLWVFNPILDFDYSEKVLELENRGDSLESERIRFVGWVNRVLSLHLSETIDEFRVLFDLDNSNADDIDRWIGFAFAKRVKRLELDMVHTYSGLFECLGLFENGLYTFPNIHRPEERLRFLHLGLSTCDSLVSLRLTKIHITQEVLEFFISNCPFLKELRLKNVHGFKTLRSSGQAIRLRCLEIINCRSCKRLEIGSPNLVSCTFTALYTTVVMKDISSLVNLSLGAIMPRGLSNNLLDMSGCLSRLETLTLETTTLLDNDGIGFPDLPRLKKLVFDIHGCHGGSLLCFTSLINAAPLLHEIVLKLTWSRSLMQRQARRPNEEQKHECLKIFEIIGFASEAVAVEVALYVLEIATSLEKMIINGKVETGKGLNLLKEELASSACCRDITG